MKNLSEYVVDKINRKKTIQYENDYCYAFAK